MIEENSFIGCPKCGTINTKDSAFCTGCGFHLNSDTNESIRLVCPKCGCENSPGFLFCFHCGESLANDKESKEGNEKTNDEPKTYNQFAASSLRKTYRIHWALFWIEIVLMIIALGIRIYLSAAVYQYEMDTYWMSAVIDTIIVCSISLVAAFVFGLLATKNDWRFMSLLYVIACLVFGGMYSGGNNLIVCAMPIIPVAWLIVRYVLGTQYSKYLERITKKCFPKGGEVDQNIQPFVDCSFGDISQEVSTNKLSRLFVTGIVAAILGIALTVWSYNYEPSFEEKANALFFGDRIEDLEMAKTLKILGPVVIAIGVAMIAYALYRRRPWQKMTISHQTEADPIEQIKQYKELLDLGIITQEEFEKKKAEILRFR